MIGISREDAASFVEDYGRAWERWDVSGFVDLFSDEVVYVAHATQETVVGRPALASYLRKEAAERVRMGSPVIEGDRVAAEFWVTASGTTAATIAGCFVARLAPDGRCSHFREYWFDVEGHASAYEGWASRRAWARAPSHEGLWRARDSNLEFDECLLAESGRLDGF